MPATNKIVQIRQNRVFSSDLTLTLNLKFYILLQLKLMS